MQFNLLCCDGGGIRGLITALLIQDLDNKYHLVENADGFAGTSTGGLISLGLANKVSIADIVNVYAKDGKTIFEPNGWLLEDGKNIQGSPGMNEDFFSGPGIWSCQYKNTGLKAVAQGLLGEATLSSSAKFVAVNSARLWNGSSWEPCTLSNRTTNPYRDTRMVDASLATSAAPTYFPPYEIGAYGYFADGGTFANNPSMSAISEVIAANLASDLREIKVLSIGTGLDPEGIPPVAVGDPLNWGVTSWLYPFADSPVPATALLNLTLDCSASVAAEQAQLLLGNNYCRANFRLPTPVALDDYQKTNELEQFTEKYLASADWAGVCKWVEENWLA